MADEDSELDFLALDALDELIEMYQLPQREPGELDINQIAAAWKCVRNTAKSRMDKLIEDGQWTSRLVEGRLNVPVRVYRKAK